MIKKLLLCLALFGCAAPASSVAQTSGGVQQSGQVTPGHVPTWVTNGVIQDGGVSTNGNVNTLGITANGGTPFCVQDTKNHTGIYDQICMGVNSSSAHIDVNGYGGNSSLPLIFNINGTAYPFSPNPGGLPTIINIAALRLNTASLGNIYALGYYAKNDGGQGVFEQNGTSCVDNGGTIIKDAAGNCFYRQINNTVTPEMFGAKGDGSTDDHVSIGNALSLCLPVWFKAATTYNIGTAGLKLTCGQPIIYGNNAILTFSGTPSTNTTGCAVDMNVNTDPWIAYITIGTTGSGSGSAPAAIANRVKALCARSQSGYYNSIFMATHGNHSVGLYLPWDSGTSTAPYYNSFQNVNFTGENNNGATDNQPFVFETGVSPACGQGPNGNVWSGGNLTSYDVPAQYRGSGNTIIATFQGWASSSAAVEASVDTLCGAGTGNFGNSIGGYWEGGRSGQTAIKVDANVSEFSVLPSFITSVSTLYDDAGTGTNYVGGRTGTFTPTMTDGTHQPTYSQQTGVYSTNSNTVQGSLTVITTNKGSLSGAITFCGLPFPVSGTLGSNSTGGASLSQVQGVTLDSPNYTLLGVQAVNGTSCLEVFEYGSGSAIAPAQLAAANFNNATTIIINFSYRRY